MRTGTRQPRVLPAPAAPSLAAAAWLALAAPFAAMALPSMRLEVRRPRIYEGETATVTVTVTGDQDVGGVPAFPDFEGGSIEHFDTRSSSSSSISVVNGRMTKEVSVSKTFYYRATPSGKGRMTTGRARLRLDDGTTIETPGGASVEVVGADVRPDAFATISAATNTVLVDSPFSVTLTVSLRALEPPNGDFEPVCPSRPLHVEAPFLGDVETRGLKLRPADESLAPLLAEDPRSTPGFTVNSFTRRPAPSMGGLFGLGSFADPFGESQSPCVFRFPPKRVTRNGVDFWDYPVSVECKPEAEGSYTFGPARVKGPIVLGANPDGSPRLDPVYLVAPALTVRVVPPPEAGRPAFFVGSVGKGMSATATLDTDHCKVGDPLALTLDLRGEISTSNLRAPVLSLQPDASPDFRVYDDNVESSRLPDGRRFKYRVRPLRAGTLEFPAISVAYYDTASNRYVTATTRAMPVQVEATTQIAATSGEGAGPLPPGAGRLVGARLAPDGIMASPGDEPPCSFAYGGKGLVALGAGPPALWAVAWLLKKLFAALRRRAGRRNYNRLAAAALRDFRRASRVARADPPRGATEAARAVRSYVAARCRSDSAGLTAAEIRSMLAERGFDGELVRRFSDAFSRLEQLPYGRDGVTFEGVSEVLGTLDRSLRALAAAFAGGGERRRPRLLLLAALSLLPALSPAMGRAPDSFEWERANEAMASAKTPGEYEDAARLYYGQVTNGAASGPLFFNLGTALLLAGKPGDARRAFAHAERYLGTFGGLSRNRELALADQEATPGPPGSPRRLPVSRVFLCWHYGLPWAARTDIAVGGWILFWAALLFRLLFTRRAPAGTAPGVLRGFTNLLAVLGLLLSLCFGASSAVSRLLEEHDVISLPGLAETPAPRGDAGATTGGPP